MQPFPFAFGPWVLLTMLPIWKTRSSHKATIHLAYSRPPKISFAYGRYVHVQLCASPNNT
jgi:hypothetical protein